VTREVVAVRDIVRPPAVFVRRVGPRQGVGVIHLVEFAETTAAEFDAALNTFVSQGVDGIVLDLRNNSGGVLAGAVHVVDRFLSQGVIVRMEGRAPGANKSFSATAQKEGPAADVPDTLPLVVLVNGRSASASEVVSGALQDHRRALLVGERTYGKFLVQQITELPRGDCAVQLVTSRYYTPSGRSYQRHLPPGESFSPGSAAEPDADEAAGLLPDVVQPLTKEERERLARFYDNEEDKCWGCEPTHAEVPGNWIDPQLQRALEVLDGELALRKIRQTKGR
jgi:carboxyl-terminal processing protease